MLFVQQARRLVQLRSRLVGRASALIGSHLAPRAECAKMGSTRTEVLPTKMPTCAFGWLWTVCLLQRQVVVSPRTLELHPMNEASHTLSLSLSQQRICHPLSTFAFVAIKRGRSRLPPRCHQEMFWLVLSPFPHSRLLARQEIRSPGLRLRQWRTLKTLRLNSATTP